VRLGRVALTGEIFAEKILVVAARIAAINPSRTGGWARAALLFSPRPRHAAQARPISSRAPFAEHRFHWRGRNWRDATTQFIAARGAVADRTPVQADRRHCSRQLAVRRRL